MSPVALVVQQTEVTRDMNISVSAADVLLYPYQLLQQQHLSADRLGDEAVAGQPGISGQPNCTCKTYCTLMQKVYPTNSRTKDF